MARKPQAAGRKKPAAVTPKQRRFIEEYLADLNATQAAIRAGYSKKTANEQGARLLAKASVAEAISAALSERAARSSITADWVLQRLREEAELEGEGARHSARVRALELLGKHLGMFGDRLEIRGEASLRIVKKVVPVDVSKLTNDELHQIESILVPHLTEKAGSAEELAP